MIVLHTQYIVCGRVCVWNQNLCIFFQFVSLRRHSFVCADEFVCFALSLFFARDCCYILLSIVTRTRCLVPSLLLA